MKNHLLLSLGLLISLSIFSQKHWESIILESDTSKYYNTDSTRFTETTNVTASNLPIIKINTLGLTILNEPKITARMSVINNSGGVNNINDTVFEFDGYIGIEIRGSSSQMFEKKSYGFETRTDSGTNLNVSLLGLPKENDWILYGPYTDKSLIRDVLAYYLGNLTGRWSPRTRFCEVYVNTDYRGVYVLVEKIKIDKNRLNLAGLQPTDISGDALTGGYILKIDRPDPGYWISPYKARNDIQNVPISYVDPEYADLAVEQRAYIRNYVTSFENAMRGSNYKDPVLGYRPFINTTSFVDCYIINELSRNLDGYRVSTYFYKDRDSKGGKITMGPFWDYNLTFGNANFFSAGNTNGWVVDGLGNGDQYGIPFWWDKFRLDPYFNSQLKIRWNELRSNKFSNINVNKFIDSCVNVLATAQQRNFQKFNILSTYVWPNNYIGGTYANEITYLKTWIKNRFVWMDAQIGAIVITSDKNLSEYAQSLNVRTLPNPFKESVAIEFTLANSAKVNIVIQDILGQTVCSQTKACQQGANDFSFNEGDFNTASNLYIYKLIVNGELVHTGKLMKK